jgi:hypothetical protein
MSDPKATERAIKEIEKQLEELNELRNASTRDPVFKFWRQTTLTSIQRTWPGDDARSSRFRRIPFSPPSTRVDAKMAREWFERGCGEAGVLLRELLTELETIGIAHAAPTKRSRPEPLPVDEVPILNLGGPSNAAPPPSRPAPHSPPPTIARVPNPPAARERIVADDAFAPIIPDDALESADTVESAEVPAPPKSAAPEPVAPVDPPQRAPARPGAHARPMPGMTPVAGSTPAPRRAAGTGGRAAKKSHAVKRPSPKMRLKDMLGFSDGTEADAPTESVHEAPPPAQRPAPEAAPPRPARADNAVSDTAPPRVTRAGSALPEAAAPPEFQMPPVPIAAPPRTTPAAQAPQETARIDEATLQRALEAAIQNFVSRDPEPESDTFDLLSSSPIFNVKAKPVRRRAPGPEGTYRTPAAVAVAVIATEMTTLNIPETQRARASAALLDLAGHLDQHDLTWDTLKEAVGFVMEYPTIARRVLPILLPFLEEAA